jgi:hypothetical protein
MINAYKTFCFSYSNTTNRDTQRLQQREDTSDFHRGLGAMNEHVESPIHIPYIASGYKYSGG